MLTSAYKHFKIQDISNAGLISYFTEHEHVCLRKYLQYFCVVKMNVLFNSKIFYFHSLRLYNIFINMY